MKIKNVFFCDDIRQELGGKVSVMGLMGNSITLNVPAEDSGQYPLQLAVLITLENPGKEYKKIDLSSELFTEDKPVGQLNALFELKGDDTTYNIPIPKFSMPVTKAMDIKIKVKVKSENQLIAEQEATLHVKLNKQVITPS